MNNSKLLELHKTLTVIEKKRFAEYLDSPFFNTNSRVIRLNQLIAKAIESKKEADLDRKKAHEQLFGNDKYNDQNIRDVMSFLMRQLEDFISHQNIDKNKLLKKEHLLIELRERNLDKHFISNTNEYLKLLEEKKTHDADYFYERYLLEKELDHFFVRKEVRKSNESLQRKSDNLDSFYLSEKLKNLCDMINRKNIIAAEYKINMLDELLLYINKNIKEVQATPAIYIYYKILLGLLESEVPQHFNELKTALDKHSRSFSKEEARQMYDYAENYCIKKINNGNQEYLAELFSIYESLLASEVIFEGNHLSQLDYKNIVSVALRLNKFEWTKDFIENYKGRIPAKFRKNAYEYNLAVYYYGKKDYKNALKLLQQVEFTDAFYHLGAKWILLKIYYELDDVEPFYSMIDAYNVFLVRNKNISAYQRKVHQNFVKYTKQAFDLKLKGSSLSKTNFEKAIIKLKERINQEKNDTNLSWLLERVEEL
jgi:hypothetical protein